MAILNFKSLHREQGDWKIHISMDDPLRLRVSVYLIHRQGDKVFNATSKSGELKLTEVKEGIEPVNPLMRVPVDVWQLMVDAIADTTPPTKKEVVDGILEATKFHLEDMRKLVFEKKEDSK